MPAKAVFLISPTYRRWLTPDFTDIEFELDGFDPKDETPWQAHLLTRDLDSDAESRSVTPLDGAPKTFKLATPQFHRRAEIVLMIEDRRTKEPVCEGRWRLTNIPKEDLPNLSYFDSRGVFFHEGQGRFPIVAEYNSWLNHDARPPLEAYAAVGFSGVSLTGELIDDRLAAAAEALKLMLFPVVSIKPTAVKSEVRRLIGYRCVAGYSPQIASRTPARADRLDPLHACRAADPSRPVIVRAGDHVGDEQLGLGLEEFQDVLLVENRQRKGDIGNPPLPRTRNLAINRNGQVYFVSTPISLQRPHDWFAAPLLVSIARGAAALFVDVNNPDELTDNVMKSLLADAAPVVHAVVRGIPERGEETADHWTWRRRLGPNERAVIEVKRSDPPTATFTVYRDSP